MATIAGSTDFPTAAPCLSNGERKAEVTHGRTAWVWVFAGALVLQLIGTWTLPLFDRDEPRFAEASREMLRSGDYVVPHFNGADRLDKPPLIYWLQAASMRVFGENEFAARFPSAVACAGLAALLCLAGTRLASPAAGLRAAVIFITALQVLVNGRLALADMVMVFFVGTGFWAGWVLAQGPERSEARSRAGWWWVYYGSLALGFLAKGPIAWLPLLAPIWAARHGLARVEGFRLGAGMALTLGLIALWGVPAQWQTHGEFVRVGLGHHVFQRMVFSFEGHGSHNWLGYFAHLPFYLVTIIASFAPWSVFLPWLVFRAGRDPGLRPLEGFLGLGVAVTFGLFTLMNTKLPHYTLPSIPLLALWLALRWPESELHRRVFAWLAVGMTMLAIAMTIGGSWWAREHLVVAKLQTTLAPWLEPGTRAMALNYDAPSLVWTLRGGIESIQEAEQPADLPLFMAGEGRRLCVLPSALKTEVFPTIPATWQEAEVEGLNLDTGKPTSLIILVKDK